MQLFLANGSICQSLIGILLPIAKMFIFENEPPYRHGRTRFCMNISRRTVPPATAAHEAREARAGPAMTVRRFIFFRSVRNLGKMAVKLEMKVESSN